MSKKKDGQKGSRHLRHTHKNPPSYENTTTLNKNKNKEQSPEIEIITLKDQDLLPNANNIMTQRTIEIATVAVIVNHRIPTQRLFNYDLPKEAQTWTIDLTLKLIIFQMKQLISPINSHPQHWNTHKSSNTFTKIQNLFEFTYHTKLKVQFHLAKSNTATYNNYQIYLIL